MRIVSGEFKGRRLVAPKGRGVRPSLEVVREAIFDSLGSAVEGARVLDLFGGSGALGLEALSRGAGSVTWCDSSGRSVRAIKENVRRLEIPGGRCTVLSMTAQQAIRLLSRRGEEFGLVFLDPPYEALLYEETMLALSLSGLTARCGTVVVEHSRRIDLSPVYGDLVRDRSRKYGETCVSWYARAGKSEEGT